MKLHLPKALLTAVLATCATSAAWATISVDTNTHTAKDSDSAWEMTYDPAKTTIYSEDAEIKTGTTNDIILSGGTLFLQTWGSPSEDIKLDGDIYMGSTIRLGLDSEDVYINNLYLVDSAEINQNTEITRHKFLNIVGTVTDKIPTNGSNSVTTSSTLTLKGANINLSGNVDVSGLIIDNKAKVTFTEDSVLTLNSTININGNSTLTLNGRVEMSNFTQFEHTVLSDVVSATENGVYSADITCTVIKGNGISDASKKTEIIYKGQAWDITNGNITFSGKAYSVVDNTKTVIYGGANATNDTADVDIFYINGGNLTLTEGTWDATHNIYYTSGAIELGADAIIAVTSTDNISPLLKNTTGNGTFEIKTNTLIAGATGGSQEVYNFAGTLNVNKGNTLYLGDTSSGANSFWALNMKNASIALDGSKIRYFGGDSNLGTITSKGSSTLDLYATCSNASKKALTIDKLHVTSDTLSMIGDWESNANIKALILDGTLHLKADTKHSGANSKVTIDQLSGSGMLQAEMGHYVLSSGTHSIGTVDLSKGNTNTGSLTLKEGANLSVNSNLWMSTKDTAKILLEKDASYSQGAIKVIGLEGNSSSISRNNEADTGTNKDLYSLSNHRFSINNAAVEVNSSNATSISNRLVGVELTNKGTGTVSAINGNNSFTSVNADKGSIDLAWFNQYNQQGVFDNLTIADGKHIGFFKGHANDSDIADISTSALTIGVLSKLKANVTLTDGATLTLNGYGEKNAATITGTLKLGTELKLEGSVVKAIEEMQVDDKLLLLKAGNVIFGEVDAAAFGEYADLSVAADAIVKATPLLESIVDTKAYFSSLNVENYKLLFENGALYIQYVNPIPEPTTATLSLLALAALASRRRRK